jgi:hypothetical protein
MVVVKNSMKRWLARLALGKDNRRQHGEAGAD